MQHKINRWAGYAVLMAAPLGVSADAVRVYDVDDYVQDGLVLHFDGIRNAGATEAHSTDATTWANLGSLGDSRIRLTWTWRKRIGLIISFH